MVREPLAQLLRKLVFRAGDRFLRQYYFDPSVQDRLGRQQFFSDAFKALRFNGISGDYVEFGSGWGRTLALAYKSTAREGTPVSLWTFDSFQGLPAPEGDEDEHPRWREGQFKTTLDEFHASCEAQGVPRGAYTVVPGFFADTLPRLSAADQPRDIALAYVDCDLYTSTKTVLDFLAPRLKHGMILAFDDYYNWSPNQLAGERRAFEEFFGDRPRWAFHPYLKIGWHGLSFVVEDQELRQVRSAS